jgi:hypothetical protein
MAANSDPLSAHPDPLRVFYATGRMLGVDDFQAEQTYHRGRLARVLATLAGSGTISGLNVQTHQAAQPEDLEIQVSPGIAIDRAGRVIDVPYQVCIRLDRYLKQDENQAKLLDAFKGGFIVADVFVSFVACDRGKTPSFATDDDYDATDAFVANRVLDSFAMLLVLRTDPTPKLPQDVWQPGVPLGPPAGDQSGDLKALKQAILTATDVPSSTFQEYPEDPDFDRTSVFLARVSIPATQTSPGATPTYDLTKVTNDSIDNLSRLFLYPTALLARFAGMTTGGA